MKKCSFVILSLSCGCGEGACYSAELNYPGKQQGEGVSHDFSDAIIEADVFLGRNFEWFSYGLLGVEASAQRVTKD